jgi:hypothetical protein
MLPSSSYALFQLQLQQVKRQTTKAKTLFRQQLNDIPQILPGS